jgi:Ca2+-transporting ATPase
MLTKGLLIKSLAQGLMIFAAAFGTYLWALAGNPVSAPAARSMGLGVVMLANLLLVQVNASERDFIFHTARRLAKDKVMWAVNQLTLAGLAAILYTPLHEVLKLAPLSGVQLASVLGMALVSTLWYELVKAIAGRRSKTWAARRSSGYAKAAFFLCGEISRPYFVSSGFFRRETSRLGTILSCCWRS